MSMNIVVFTGAGISAESGLKTFRDADGLWEGHKIEDVASPEGWKKNPQRVLDFYNQRRNDVIEAFPNAAHIGLASLEKDFNVHVITQNIDDLHERGGSTNVLHLHGEILKMRSEHDDSLISDYTQDIALGDKASDGKQLRPHIVWFGEAVPLLDEAKDITRNADALVIIGTSLVVYPAAGLVLYAGHNIPKFYIDKKIPPVTNVNNLTRIQKPATEGINELIELLNELK